MGDTPARPETRPFPHARRQVLPIPEQPGELVSQRWIAKSSFSDGLVIQRPATRPSRRGFLPNAYADYMETSRRGPVTRDSRGYEEYTRERRDHRGREPYRPRSRSLERNTGGYGEHTRGWEREEDQRAREYRGGAQKISSSTRRHRSRSIHRSPQQSHESARQSWLEPRHDLDNHRFERDRRRDSPRALSREIPPTEGSDRGQATGIHHPARGFDRGEAFPVADHRPPPRDSHYHSEEVLQRSHSRHRYEDRGRDPYRSHHFPREYSHSPSRENPAVSARRPHSPEHRWTRAEVEEYYRRQDEEGAWRYRRESPHARERVYDEYYRARELSRDYPTHPEQHRPHHEWLGRWARTDDSEYPEYRDADHRRYPHSRFDDRMEGTRPIQSVMDEAREPREPRGQRIPSFEGSHRGRGRGRGGFDTSRGRGGYHGHGPPPPQIDTRHQYPSNSHYGTPAGSYHGSPHSASPYSQHGGWQTPQHYYHAPPAHAYAATPQTRPGSYPPQQPPTYYAPHPHQYPPTQPQTPTYPPSSYRGGHAPQRGGNFPPPQDRRFSGGSVAGSPPQTGAQPATRGGRGHFQNLRWTASGGTQGGKPLDGSDTPAQDPREQSEAQSTAPPPPPPAQKEPAAPPPPEEDNPFRPSKAFRVEDDSTKPEEKTNVQVKEAAQTPKEPRFSFAFKGKAVAPPAAKPVTDLTQKMKDPPVAPRRDLPQDTPKKPAASFSRDGPANPPASVTEKKAEFHSSRDPRDRFAGQRQQREAEAERYKAERQAQLQRTRPTDRQTRDTDRREVERANPKLQMVKVKQKRKRMKARPQLAPELKASKSVYYRKQGNESVVGSGTYGKVYKALHVYTGTLVALKKIRMEGEKDGFPVTAVREIKLLQSLRHNNVVRLQEVMVENNDCYMVFEYLSHDLTGLLNHPTFKLEHAHKKDLAKQLLQSLDYLHRRGVLHRDLKAANILVSSDGQLKLADFGLARFYSKHHTLDYTNRVITIWYRPPELLLGETQYGPAVDVWSAACVLVEIFTKHAIFPGDGGEINQLEKIYNVLGTPTRSEWPGLADMAWFELLRPAERRRNIFREKYAHRLSEQAFELLAAMFQYDPAKRPTASEILEHPYFATEEPAPKQAIELANVDGDWHEFESKALRKENERKARKAAEAERDKSKRRASSNVPGESQRDTKRAKNENATEDTYIPLSNTKEKSTGTETMADIEPNMEPN